MNHQRSNSRKGSRLRFERLEVRTLLTSQMLADFIGGENQLTTSGFHELNGETYFVRSGLENVELWKTDGSNDGTERVSVLTSQPKHATYSVRVNNIGDELLISLSDNDFSFIFPKDRDTNSLTFLSDGTSEGTRTGRTLLSGLPQNNQRTQLIPYAFDLATEGEVMFAYGVPEPIDAPILPHVYVGISDGGVSRSIGNRRMAIQDFAIAGENLVVSSLEELGFFDYDTELWVSNGDDASGSRLDLWPSGESNPRDLVEVGARVFFTAQTDVGRELWQSDGTSDGTQLVSDIREGDASSNPTGLVSLDDHVFLVADDGRGESLWKSDGTTTSRVDTSGTPAGLYSTGEEIYFATLNAEPQEMQFWSLDSATAMPALVGSLPQPAEAVDVAIQKFEGILLATATDAEQTKLVSITADEVVDLGQFGHPRFHGQAGNDVFFSSNDELWKTNGLVAEEVGATGTTAVTQISDDAVLFSATVDGTAAIWSYDGATKTQLKPLPKKSGSIQVHSITNVGDVSLLMVSDVASQRVDQACFTCGPRFTPHLIATDGESFELLEDSPFLFARFAFDGADFPVVYADSGNAYFAIEEGPNAGVWSTDFTAEGTLRRDFESLQPELASIDAEFVVTRNQISGPGEFLVSNSPMQTFRMGTTKNSFPIGTVGNVRFENRYGNKIELGVLNEWGSYWVDDSLSPLVNNIVASSQLLGRDDDGAVYFAAETADGMQLWKGVAEGNVEPVTITSEILDTLTSTEPNRGSGEILHFHALTRGERDQIWSLDVDGFEEVPLPDDVEIKEFLTVVNGHAIFLSETDAHGVEIWSSDLTAAQKVEGDINGDGEVKFDDFLILSQNFGLEVSEGVRDGDLDEDGVVTFADFLVLAASFQGE